MSVQGAAGGYEQVLTLSPKQAFWVYYAAQDHPGIASYVPVTGTVAPDATVSLTLGANLVGPIASPAYAPLALPLTTLPAGQVSTTIWYWGGSWWRPATQLEPGLGRVRR